MESGASLVSPAGGRRLLLEVVSPTVEPRRFVLAPGASARVGRTSMSDFVIAEDEHLSGAHFLIEWDGVTAALCDLQSAGGTLVGGAKIAASALRHGDWIRAGGTDFRVYFEGHSLLRAQSVTNPIAAHAREEISRRAGDAGGQLHALLDAARSPRVLELLKESVDEHQSLFDGLGGASLWRVAPYLVKLAPEGSGMFARLLEEGLGRSFGIFVVSGASFKEVRRHFRRLLRVEDPERRPMFFRLYDPRVLRTFLPTCSERQLEELFAGVVSAYVAEGESPGEVHVFRLGPGLALREERVRLGRGEAVAQEAR